MTRRLSSRHWPTWCCMPWEKGHATREVQVIWWRRIRPGQILENIRKGVGRMADESNAAKGVRGRLPVWPRNALNPSVIAAEQAYRKRSGLPLLTDSDIE